MTYPEWKKKVHAEFDEKFPALVLLGGWGSSVILDLEGREKDREIVKAFLDTALDNLLVEVEGLVPELVTRSMFMKSITHADVELASVQARAMEIGYETCRSKTLQALALFKGEDTSL